MRINKIWKKHKHTRVMDLLRWKNIDFVRFVKKNISALDPDQLGKLYIFRIFMFFSFMFRGRKLVFLDLEKFTHFKFSVYNFFVSISPNLPLSFALIKFNYILIFLILSSLFSFDPGEGDGWGCDTSKPKRPVGPLLAGCVIVHKTRLLYVGIWNKLKHSINSKFACYGARPSCKGFCFSVRNTMWTRTSSWHLSSSMCLFFCQSHVWSHHYPWDLVSVESLLQTAGVWFRVLVESSSLCVRRSRWLKKTVWDCPCVCGLPCF